jgi:hypothetical protein
MEFRPTSIVEVETEYSRGLKTRRVEHYLRGPIPLADIQVAAKLGGSCLALLLAIHHRIAVTKWREVTLPTGLLSEFGINYSAKWRGLKLLEKAKLIIVKRERGNSARIKLVSGKRQKARFLSSRLASTAAGGKRQPTHPLAAGTHRKWLAT